MALVTCPECKKEVSDSADACPHCGFVNPGLKIECSQCGTDIRVGILSSGLLRILR